MKNKLLKIVLMGMMLSLVFTGCGKGEKESEPEQELVVEKLELEGEGEASPSPEATPETSGVIGEREVVDGKMQSYLTGEWKDEGVVTRRPIASYSYPDT